MEWWLAPGLQDPDLQARFRELRGRIEGCVCTKSIMGIHGNSTWECKRFCPKSESDNHVPAIEDINHVAIVYSPKTGFVCLTSGCKSSHENEGPREKDSLKVDPVTVKPEDRNQEVTDKINLKADTVTVKPEDKNQDVTDKTDQEATKQNFHDISSNKSEIPTTVKIEDDITNDVIEKDEEILVEKKFSGIVNETSIIEPITINNISEEDEET